MRHALNGFKNLPFKYKILLSYIVVILIPVLSLGLYSFQQSKGFLEKQERRSLTTSAEKIADHLAYKISLFNNITNFIVYNTRLQQLFNNNYKDKVSLTADLKTILEPTVTNIQFINQGIKEVTFYSKRGMPEYGTLVLDYARIGNELWAVETEGNYVPKWISQNGELFIARKFIDIYSDKELGIVSIALDYDQIFKETLFMNAQEYGVVIVDDSKRLIYSNRSSEDADEALASDRFMKVEQRIANSGWTLQCYVPYDFILKESGQILGATIVVCLACILFLLLIIWVFSNTLVKRILHLNVKMKQVEIGQLAMEVSSDASDEIGQLTNRFGKMLKTINYLIEDVYQSKLVQKEAELRALQAQIRPHFLYNSLNIINWRAIMNNDTETSSIATRLSEFYRTTLNKGDNIISIKDELLNMKAYIDIQLIMHEYNFDVHYELDEGIYAFDMLNLILQPIVENAIEHGIDCKTEGRGELVIRGIMNEEQIQFVIADNGPGMDKERVNRLLNEQSSGYGLKNVNERLQLYFGDTFSMMIESELNEGTVCRINIPKYCREHNSGFEAVIIHERERAQ
ncbi:sensor histidine kinase [Paenibacillus baekrokdamisoli]|uniref:histidine kinase n=1 Tax=Paenibacillus baekrokdamisoli TaxID=1712516 RepID=A0A3G9J3A6_9BACL|nr:sensor histidine kinase [Paenibacillus baekrokdamisoli]MBB3069381.1 two-component system sensor histidine kinase YesM [Paenibacillus baekrokdamisoli]BBH25062.1 sensor histidine kinase [Paenibacillus baekrokdamisoli]